MPLNKYWTRTSMILGPSSTQPLGSSQLLGGLQALRTPEDVLLRTRFNVRTRYTVTNSTPPSVLTGPKMILAHWAEYRPSGDSGIGTWPDGIDDLVAGETPRPYFIPHSQDNLTYSYLFEQQQWTDTPTMRHGHAAEGAVPGVNVGVQVFDETGNTFPPARFSQNLEYYGFLELVWGSTV